MGYLFKGVCYPAQTQVRQEVCSSAVEGVTSGGALVSHSCAPGIDYTATSASMQVTTNGAVSSTYAAPWPPDIACEHDGSIAIQSEMFALILGFLVVVWVAGRIKQFFWRDHEAI